MQIRILASSKQSFDLRCEIRSEALPRQRSEAVNTGQPAAAAGGGPA
jgi:hypothetical protein